ncbi:MAG: hypothetical protein IPO88_27875 [Nannocystis sp.]|uniref:hypothetical protein n=1 Tax=Nannocystis sp. TaxID=1962667 RepID=UPI00242522DC|nr:hypothetical protein [Nannocystis sp.]MBK9757249.1 hypothetical protein [Nannocystis sp.]
MSTANVHKIAATVERSRRVHPRRHSTEVTAATISCGPRRQALEETSVAAPRA